MHWFKSWQKHFFYHFYLHFSLHVKDREAKKNCDTLKKYKQEVVEVLKELDADKLSSYRCKCKGIVFCYTFWICKYQ